MRQMLMLVLLAALLLASAVAARPLYAPESLERFFRLDQSRARHTGGSGLGLAICREVLTLHGGTITIAASSPAGTTVEIRIPGQGAEGGAEAAQVGVGKAAGTRRRRDRVDAEALLPGQLEPGPFQMRLPVRVGVPTRARQRRMAALLQSWTSRFRPGQECRQ